MRASRHPRVKVCCITSADEAAIAVAAGAAAVGLVGEMPSGPGVITDHEIAAIARAVPPPVATFLLTSRQSAGEIAAHHAAVRTTTIQIVDRLTHGTYEGLREALPGTKLVQVIHVTGSESVDEALAVAPDVDALLLDSGNPALAVKELGGTGRVHDWQVSRRIRELSPIPVFLAGGLRASNVGEAIERVGPFGLDVCSGVRTDGRLDAGKLASFMEAVRAAGHSHT
jgi:phosphoribosylanthranilate isomerase